MFDDVFCEAIEVGEGYVRFRTELGEFNRAIFARPDGKIALYDCETDCEEAKGKTLELAIDEFISYWYLSV